MSHHRLPERTTPKTPNRSSAFRLANGSLVSPAMKRKPDARQRDSNPFDWYSPGESRLSTITVSITERNAKGADSANPSQDCEYAICGKKKSRMLKRKRRERKRIRFTPLSSSSLDGSSHHDFYSVPAVGLTLNPSMAKNIITILIEMSMAP